MKLHQLFAVGFVAGVMGVAGAANAQAPAPGETVFAQKTKEVLVNKVQVGTRVTMFELKDKERPLNNRYLGSINKLDEDQDYAPIKAFLKYWPVDWAAVGVSYDKIRAETLTDEPGKPSYTDGTLQLDGPIYSLTFALPNKTPVTPYVELGWMDVSGSFDGNSSWSNAHGIDGYQTLVIRKSDGGATWGVGCDIQIKGGWACNLLYREIDAEMTVDQVIMGSINEANSNRKFDLSSRFFGGGVSYRF